MSLHLSTGWPPCSQCQEDPGLAEGKRPWVLGKEVWPPSSPDCNPLDFYLWGVLEKDINRRPYNIMDELKTAIIAARAAVNICFPKSLYPCVLPLSTASSSVSLHYQEVPAPATRQAWPCWYHSLQLLFKIWWRGHQLLLAGKLKSAWSRWFSLKVLEKKKKVLRSFL